VLFMGYLLAFVCLTRPFTFTGTSSIFVTASIIPLLGLYRLHQAKVRLLK
jgi:uncharacterized membrane protein YjjP (DUF1212 family)